MPASLVLETLLAGPARARGCRRLERLSDKRTLDSFATTLAVQDVYTGSEPLDPALADRFAVILEVGDWDALSPDDRRRVADPAGEGAATDDRGCLKSELATWQRRFAASLPACPPPVVEYVCAVTTALRNAGIRLSPRRARLLTRTLLAVLVVEGLDDRGPGGRTAKALFLAVLEASLPQRAWGDRPDPNKVHAAHELAWGGTMLEGRDQWLHHFHL